MTTTTHHDDRTGAVPHRPAPITRPAVTTLVSVELRKATDTTVSRILLAGGVLVMAAAMAAYLSFVDPGQWGLQPFTAIANGILGTALALLGIILVTGEFGHRTMAATLSLVPSRARVVAAKSLAAVVMAVVGFVAAVAVAAVATAIGAAMEPDVSFSFGGAAIGQMLLFSVVSVLIGVGFGLLFQNTVVAVLVYLVLPQIVLFAGLIPGADTVTAWADVNTAAMPFSTGGAESGVQWARFAVATAVWVGVPYALGFARLARREIR